MKLLLPNKCWRTHKHTLELWHTETKWSYQSLSSCINPFCCSVCVCVFGIDNILIVLLYDVRHTRCLNNQSNQDNPQRRCRAWRPSLNFNKSTVVFMKWEMGVILRIASLWGIWFPEGLCLFVTVRSSLKCHIVLWFLLMMKELLLPVLPERSARDTPWPIFCSGGEIKSASAACRVNFTFLLLTFQKSLRQGHYRHKDWFSCTCQFRDFGLLHYL